MAKTYDTYKDSGIAWIGEIPGEWEVKRLGNFYNQRNEKVSDKDFAPLSVTMKGIVPQLETAAKTNDGDNRKLVRKGDFAINSRSDRRGSCGISDYDGSVSLINTVLCPKGEMDAGYYNWLFHTSMFADEYYKWGHGIVDDLWTTRWSEMKNIEVVNPPLSVQQSISSFLDTKCGEIDSLISIQEEMISELLAYKQSVITEAVTKGLDKKAKMKNSGVEWIGDIPEEWEVKPYKAIFYTEKGLNITKADLVEKGEPVLSYGQIHSKMNTGTKINDALLKYVPSSYIETNPECLVQKGCFLIADTSEDYDGCGNAIYVDKDMTLFAGYHTIVARPIHNNGDYKYLAYLFLTDIWRQQIRSRVSGIKVYSINQKIIRLTSVLLPPLPVQQAIAAYLDEKTTQIDSLIALKQSKIESLKEYKKSIIYEYVTGKKRV